MSSFWSAVFTLAGAALTLIAPAACKSEPHGATPTTVAEPKPVNLGHYMSPLAAMNSGVPMQFYGKDLSNWKGLVADPPARAKMSAAELAAAQAAADARMREHWSVVMMDGAPALHFDGRGDSLCTASDYGDFEMWVDWKIPPGGDSGIYLRGSPQVQIWDNPLGSGGLYNNKINPSNPLVVADKPIGEWNTFHIRMIGERVSVWLNGTLVTDNTVLENYWERDKPIYPKGQIELQNHGGELWFRNVFIRPL